MKIPSCHRPSIDPEGVAGTDEPTDRVPVPDREGRESKVVEGAKGDGEQMTAAVPHEPAPTDTTASAGGRDENIIHDDSDGHVDARDGRTKGDEDEAGIDEHPTHEGAPKATNYLAALQCFKKKTDSDGRCDQDGIPPLYSSLQENRAVGNADSSNDDVDDDDAPTEVPTSAKKTPWARRSTSTTLATSNEDDSEPLHDGSSDASSQDNDDEACTAGTKELRDVENENVDLEGGIGVEVTIRQYIWKQRWDRFYYGFLRMGRTTPAPVGCYAAALRRGSSEEAKFVGDDDDTLNWQKRRRRFAPILISLVVATVLLVVVAVGSACGSGKCSSSSSSSASAVTSPDNNNNDSPPRDDVPSASPSSSFAAAPTPTSAPAAGTNNNVETPVPTVQPPLTATDNPWMDRTPEPTWAKTNPVTLSSTTDLYCYPSYSERTRYSNVWGSSGSTSGYTVETKEGSYCGPGNNHFTAANVNFDNNELVLQYRQVNGLWTGSEVRVVLPDALMPYTYGTYSFSVKNVSVTDMYGQPKNGNMLSEDLVVGFFTWDDTEQYDVHENWNHEVDVELSRWMDASNEDAQFVIQPPEVPHYHRFFSGIDNTVDPGGQTYQFTWYPTNITWHASTTGESYAYTTRMALEQNLPDRIQCLPANVEVRMNVWNVKGADVAPTGMADTDVAQIVVDKFSFVPSNVVGVDDGQLCSKHCQCSGTTSMCVNSVCTAQ